MAVRRVCAQRRHGTTIVEVAVVLPVFLAFVFGIIEIGRLQMVGNVLKSACRQGARYGATEGVSTAEVLDRVDQVLACAMNPDLVTVIVKDASVFDTGDTLPESTASYNALPDVDLSEVEPGQLLLVRATVSYNDVSLLPISCLSGVPLTGQAFMRHE